MRFSEDYFWQALYLPVQIGLGYVRTVIPSAPPTDAELNIASVTVAPTQLPGGGTLSVDPDTGVVAIGTLETTKRGTYSVTVTVTDSLGAVAVSHFNVLVPVPSAVRNWPLFQ